MNPDLTLKDDSDWELSAVSVGEGASVGAGSVLLPGVRIGDWSMVGAGSIVTKDVPDYGLVLGNPACLVGYVCPCGHRLNKVALEKYECSHCHQTTRIIEQGGRKGRSR